MNLTRIKFIDWDKEEGNLSISFLINEEGDKFSDVSVLNSDGVNVFNKDPKKYVGLISSYLLPVTKSDKESIEDLILKSWRMS